MPSTLWVRAGCVLLGACVLLSCARSSDAIDKKESLALSHYIAGAMLERLGQLDEAVGHYQQAARNDPVNAGIRLSLGSAYLKQNNIPKALEELNLAVKYDPQSVEAHAVLALLYFSQENLTAAGKEYEQALQKASELQPANIDIYRNLAGLYLQRKDLGQALKAFKTIIDLDPSDAQSRFYLANVYDQSGDRAEAERQLRKAIELKPDYAQALNYLGYLLVEENRSLGEAEKFIRKALEYEPDNGAFIDSLGWLFFKQGRLAEALKTLERAAGLLDDPVIFDHLGDVHARLKDMIKAVQYWRKSLELDPQQDAVIKKIDAAQTPEKK